MAKSTAATPEQYIAEIENDDRRDLVAQLSSFIDERIPAGFEHEMVYGMPGWVVPLERSGPTYNGQPLGAVSIANQKNYVTVYLMGVYGDPEVAEEFEQRWKDAGRKLDMGKSCVYIRKADDVVWDALEYAVSAIDPDGMIELHDRAHGRKG